MLEVTDLTRSYGSHLAISGISSYVADGELVTVVGPSDVADNVALPLRRTMPRRAARREAARAALKAVGLAVSATQLSRTYHERRKLEVVVSTAQRVWG